MMKINVNLGVKHIDIMLSIKGICNAKLEKRRL